MRYKFFPHSDFDVLQPAALSPDLHTKGTQSVLLVNGSNKRVIPVQRASKKEGSLPFTVKDVDPHVTSTTHVSLDLVLFKDT